MSDNVKVFQAGAFSQAFDFFRNLKGHFGGWDRVESPEKTAKIKGEDCVAIVPKAVLHDFPNVPGLHESVEQQNVLCLGIPNVSVTVDLLAATVDFSNATEVVS